MSQPDQHNPSLLRIFLELVLVSLLLAGVPFVVYLDTSVIGVEMKENSLTELLHNIGALIAMICFLSGAKQYPDQRAFLALAASLFAMISIRELDFLFDGIVHGFWIYPALVALAAGLFAAWRAPGTFLRPLARYLQSREATFVYLGFVMLVVFTRLFGTGDLWEGVMKEDYHPRVKAAVQEGLELMSYVLIAYGAVASWLRGFAAPRT